MYADVLRDLLLQLQRPEQAVPEGGAGTIPFGLDQAENQVDQLFRFWQQGYLRHPYLPGWTPRQFDRPAPLQVSPEAAPWTF